MTVISVVNQKGGVGKTTTCVNVGAGLAIHSKRVLIIDLDLQGSASTSLKIINKTSIYDVLCNNTAITSSISRTNVPNLDIIPANVSLSACDIELLKHKKRENVLRNKLSCIRDQYDYILIDCPPALNLLTINALTCCDSVIIPMQCEFLALEGLSHLLKTTMLIQKNLNKNICILGVLLVMYDCNVASHRSIRDDVRYNLKHLVFATEIPRSHSIPESQAAGTPCLIHNSDSIASYFYLKLIKEILGKT